MSGGHCAEGIASGGHCAKGIASGGHCAEGIANKIVETVPPSRKALLGAFTILINLYQNCYATFSYVRQYIAPKDCGQVIAPVGYCVRRTLHP
jgi:hypothetical protein